MIFVDRSRVPPPPSFESERLAREIERARAFFAVPREERGQRLYPFQEALWNEARPALMELFHGKCAYCETPVRLDYSADVEHHRPKYRAMGLDGTAAPDHYWWLVYTWENLHLSCAHCNRHKAHRFPVRNARAEPLTYGDALRHEEPLLLDPCDDDPAEHLVFTEEGAVVSETDRGRTTIEVLGLNRDSLIEERRRVYAAAVALMHQIDGLLQDGDEPARDGVPDSLREQLRHLVAHSSPFAAMTRQFVFRWAAERHLDDWLGLHQADHLVSRAKQAQAYHTFTVEQSAREAYSVESDEANTKAAYYAGARRIERIEIRDFKAIEMLDLQFPRPRGQEEPWLMLLGENGTGKSSILRAVALALMGERHANRLGLDAAQFVRRGARAGRVRIYLTNLTQPVELRFTAEAPGFTVEPPDPKVLLLGYGATRLLRRADNPDAGGQYIRIQNLFDPTAPLNDAEAWLTDEHRVGPERFDEIALALKDLLMLGNEDEIYRRDGRVYVRIYDTDVTLEELSDGFQSVVALAVDVMIALFERWPSMKIAEGIVLLDEIEVHLHPTWKISIVERLRRCFPRVTFLVTTHDPLCLKGLRASEIVVLRRDARRRIVADLDLPSVEDLRADQILTSPLFGLVTTRGAATMSKAERYEALYRLAVRTPEQEEEFRLLQAELEKAYTDGENAVQRQAEAMLRHALSGAEALALDGGAIDTLSPETRRELKARLQTLLSL